MIVDLFYTTGIRRTELINLKLQNVDLSNKTIKVIGKRNKEMNDMETACKGFLQDYFNRIIDKKLSN